MSEVQFAPPVFSAQRKINNGDVVRHGDDSELFVEFYKNAVTGRDHLKLTFPGDKHSTYDQPVKDRDKLRFAQAWHAYENQLETFPGQTRLEEVAWLDEATRNALRAAGVFTVEQLAATHDGNLHGLGMGGRGLRDRAARHVAEKQAVEHASAVDQEKEDLKKQLAEMQAQIASLSSKVEPGETKTAERPPEADGEYKRYEGYDKLTIDPEPESGSERNARGGQYRDQYGISQAKPTLRKGKGARESGK